MRKAVHLVGLKARLKKMTKWVEENLRDPTKTWLESFVEKEVEIPGYGKLQLVEKGGEDVWDNTKILVKFKELLQAGRFQDSELRRLLDDGTLTVGKGEALANLLVSRQLAEAAELQSRTKESAEVREYFTPEGKQRAEAQVRTMTEVRRALDAAPRNQRQRARSRR
jgi:hypothetical protein